MCGRFKPKKKWAELYEMLDMTGAEEPQSDLLDKSEIRPTNHYPIIRQATGGGYEMAVCRWSLVPYWFRKSLSEFKLSSFNAKIEEAADKPTFKSAFARSHCIVPVEYFWEWWGPHQTAPKKKQRWEITRADNFEMVFAGIWDRAELPEGVMESFTLMTRAAGADLTEFHTREPVTLKPDEYRDWIDGEPVASINTPPSLDFPSAPRGTFRFGPAADIPDPPKRAKAATPITGELL